MDDDDATGVDLLLEFCEGGLVASRGNLGAASLELHDSLTKRIGRSHGADPVRTHDPAESGVALDEPALRVHLDLVVFELVRRLVHWVAGSLLATTLMSSHPRNRTTLLTG